MDELKRLICNRSGPSKLSLGSLHRLLGRLLHDFHDLVLHHFHDEYALDILFVAAIPLDLFVHVPACEMQVVGFSLADADVVATSQGE